MVLNILGNSIEEAYIFFGLISFVMYKSLSIEDKKKYEHLDLLRIILLGLLTAKIISIIDLRTGYLIYLIYLFLSLFVGFIYALSERMLHHRIVPFCTILFSNLRLNTIDLDPNSSALNKILYKIYVAIHEKKKVPIKRIVFEITLKNNPQMARGYLIGYSMSDINLMALENNENNVVITNINLDGIQKIRIVIDKKSLIHV